MKPDYSLDPQSHVHRLEAKVVGLNLSCEFWKEGWYALDQEKRALEADVIRLQEELARLKLRTWTQYKAEEVNALEAENVRLREQLRQVAANLGAAESPDVPMTAKICYDRWTDRIKQAAELEATISTLTTLGAEQVREIEELRQVVKEYREMGWSIDHSRRCQFRKYPDWEEMQDDRCPACIKADALLTPTAPRRD